MGERDIPGTAWFEHPLRVRYAETDQMGVVYHARYLDWFEVGRTEMIRQLGMDYRTLEEKGLLLPVMEVDIRYKKPARYDDLVVVRTRLTALTGVRMEFEYEIRKEGTTDILVTGNSKHMWVNRQWRPCRIGKEAPELWNLLEQAMKTEGA